MTIATYTVVTVLTIVANACSGIAAVLRVGRIRAAMAQTGVPESWLVFPIGTLKIAGACGLLVGLVAFPVLGTAAAIGLVLYWVCAVHTHLLARDYSAPLAAAAGVFLPLAVATLGLSLTAT